jgi:hypothetical protein
MAQRNIVYFDLETQRTASDVGGWGNSHKMGMSIGVTYSTRDESYHIYTEAEAPALAEQLMQADLVVGFNHIGFDLAVLQPYVMWDLKDRTINLDMSVEVQNASGGEDRPPLESIAQACLGCGKTADGLDAIRWWREGNLYDIARYCAYDVKVTKLVHEYGQKHGHLRYTTRHGQAKEVMVGWA